MSRDEKIARLQKSGLEHVKFTPGHSFDDLDDDDLDALLRLSEAIKAKSREVSLSLVHGTPHQVQLSVVGFLYDKMIDLLMDEHGYSDPSQVSQEQIEAFISTALGIYIYRAQAETLMGDS